VLQICGAERIDRPRFWERLGARFGIVHYPHDRADPDANLTGDFRDRYTGLAQLEGKRTA
jgi:hypothetical protein